MADERQERLNQGWQRRAIVALHGNRSLPGTILIAALQKSARADGSPRCPSFGRTAEITPLGNIISKYVNPHGIYQGVQIVCTIKEYIDTFRKLADRLKFTDEERTELFKELRQWIAKDYRKQKGDDFEPILSPKKLH